MRPHLTLLWTVATFAAKFAVKCAGNYVGFGIAGDLIVEVWAPWPGWDWGWTLGAAAAAAAVAFTLFFTLRLICN
jgi:hypothetical protein